MGKSDHFTLKAFDSWLAIDFGDTEGIKMKMQGPSDKY